VSEARLLTADEVAELLNVPVRWVRDKTREGVIPCVPLGRYVRFDRDDVLAWRDLCKQGGRRVDWQRIRPRQYQKAVPNAR
jgi:excisionase family DNA binding protein